MKGPIGTPLRVGLGLIVVALVVGVNQLSPPKSTPRVLGTKISRCTVGGLTVAAGPRQVHADALSVSIVKGKPASVLAPPLKLAPGRSQPVAPAKISVGVGGSKPGTMNATVTLENTSSCPVTFTAVTVSALRAATTVSSVAVAFGGRDRVVLRPGGRATGRASLPATTNGRWTVEATATADVGAA
jgi:hypothetical protein